MPMLMQQEVLPMQQEYLGGGSTPAPIPTTQPVPGMGAAATPMPKPTPTVGAPPATPMPKPTPMGPDTPPLDNRSAGPMPAPMPSAPSLPGEPLRTTSAPVGGPGTAPAAPQPATFSSPVAYSGSGPVRIMDWRQGLSETNRDAVTRQVTDNELTSKQMARLLDENGRFLQSARLRAKEGASAGGMLMSTLAAGAAERAAIDASMPIAQSDAGVFANTAAQNMAAQNEDIQADQGAGRNLFGQTMALDANLQDSELNRQFQSAENAANRSFQGAMAAEDRSLTREQNAFNRELQRMMQADGLSFQAAQSELDRRLTQDQNYLQRQQTAELEANRLAQGRFDSFVNMQANRENQLAQTLASIYSNPNISADQQARAAENARAIFASLNTATNATLSSGVPQIFAQPFVRGGGAPTPTPTPAPSPGALPPGVTPIPGTTLARDPGGVIGQIADIVRNAAR